MKKIYMILAAMTLLSMSLNAQLLPAKNLGDFSFNPTGKAYQKATNGQFRMPSLGTGEYLLGPYNTDDFDATGIGYGGYYSSDQSVLAMVELTRDEFESHIGDTIIGFRFALAGSTPTPVFAFYAWPASENYWDQDHLNTWELGSMMAGNTSSEPQTSTVTGPVDVTFTAASSTTNTLTNNEVTITTGITELGGYTSMYLNGTTTISTTNGTITKIVFNGRSDNSYPVSRLSAATGNFTVSNNVATWTGSASSVRFSSTQDAGCASIVVTVQRTTTQTTYVNTVVVGRGVTTNEHIPVSGYNQDYGYHNQMIYRAGQLCMASGAQITSLTFYPEPGTGIPFAGSTVTVSLANTTTDNFGTGTSGNKITSGLTTVATITPVANSGLTEWKIDFATPFTYTGNNLLVQVSCPGYRNDNTSGQWAHANFLGDDQSANVTLRSVGNGYSTTTGTPSTFLPKATFAFTGSVNTPNYLTLAGGEWHDFFLDQPVVLELGDTIQMLAIGYDYYQYTGTSHAPTAVNSNSTGHQHRSYMATDSYSARWWNDGVSGPDNSDRPGDMAVQLIFKSKMQKTPAPTISYTEDAQYGHVTATATDPTATVTLTVGGQTATGVGSVTINIGRGETDVTVTASATAQEPGKLESDPATATYTVQASTLTPTPAPSINSQVLDVTVQVTGTGEGELHMYVDGQEVTNPDYLERTDQDYYVTVTVTAMINDGDHRMSTTTRQVLVPALTGLDLTGWTQLPGTYSNNSVINWNDNLMFVDRFSVSTAYNNHPTEYTYVMTEDTTKLIGQPRTTNDHTIPVEVTRSKVLGYYTEQDVLNDIDRQHVDTCLINADVEMTVKQSGTIYYYTLERSRNSIMDEDFLELSYLQNDGARYVEFDHYFTWQEPFQYGPVYRFDTINTVLPASAPQGTDGKHYGSYDKHDYIAYVPIVWTHGNDANNTRLNWDNDGLHNSYGSPIWRTGVGKVEFVGKPQMERQDNGSTTWKEIEGTDTTKCSIYMIKSLTVDGFLPDTTISNIKYEPYMFRVWIVSSKNKLRNFEWVPGEEGRPGSHFEGRGVIPAGTAYWLWDQPVNTTSDYITFPTALKTQFHFWKTEDEDGNNQWDIAENANMIFAGQDDITADDIQILVRFYYRSTGQALYQNVQQGNGTMLMVNRDGEKGYYGVEEPGDPDPKIPTFIRSIYDYTQTQGEVVDVTYYNMQGMQSSKPFDGINIVVTRYSNGSVSTTKVLR
jgi:hypothetical protein